MNTLNLSQEQMMDLDSDLDESFNDMEALDWEEEIERSEDDVFEDDDEL